MGNPYIDYALNALREMDRYWKEVLFALHSFILHIALKLRFGTKEKTAMFNI